MDIVNMIQLISGIILIFFLPGYMLMRLFYRHVKGLELIVLITGISISVAIILGVILGLSRIFNYWNSLIAYAITLVIMLITYYIRKHIHNSHTKIKKI